MQIDILIVGASLLVTFYSGARLFMKRPDAEPLINVVNEDADQYKNISFIKRRLRILKINIEPITFFFGMVLIAIVGFLTALEVFPENPRLSLLISFTILISTFLIMREISEIKIRRFEKALVDALDIMQAALQGGHTPQRSLEVAAKSSKEPVKSEFNEIIKYLDLGVPIQQATSRMRMLYKSESVRLFTQVLIVKWNSEGDFNYLMKSINKLVKERVKLKLNLDGQLSGVKYSSLLVAALPYMIIPIVIINEPAWWLTLTEHPAGPTLLVSAVVLQLLGFFWLRMLLRTE